MKNDKIFNGLIIFLVCVFIVLISIFLYNNRPLKSNAPTNHAISVDEAENYPDSSVEEITYSYSRDLFLSIVNSQGMENIIKRSIENSSYEKYLSLKSRVINLENEVKFLNKLIDRDTTIIWSIGFIFLGIFITKGYEVYSSKSKKNKES